MGIYTKGGDSGKSPPIGEKNISQNDIPFSALDTLDKVDFITAVTDAVLKEIKAENSVFCQTKKMSLRKAKEIIEAVEKKAEEMGVSVVISVCGSDGNPIAVHVMDGAYIISYDVSAAKAYTAVALKMPTVELKKLVQPGEMFYGLDSFGGKKIIAIGGGVPLYYKNEIIAGIGVSGGNEEQDILLASYGGNQFE